MNDTPWNNPEEAKKVRRNLGKGGKYEKPKPKRQFEAGDDLVGDPKYYYEMLGNTSDLSWEEL